MFHRSMLFVALTVAGHGCAKPDAKSHVALEAPIFVTAGGDTVRLEEELRIGSLDGPDATTFAFILWSLPAPDGGVILYDLESVDGERGHIRQFDAQGRFVHNIGGPGEGPGEHSTYPMATLLPDGSLLTADQALGRITRYDRAGELVASWSVPPAMVEITPAVDGGWYAAVVTDHPEGKPRRIEFVRFDSLGNEVTRFPASDFYHNGPYGGIGAVDNPTSVVTIIPDGRIVSARNDSLLLVVSNGTNDVRVTAPHEPVAYLDEEAAARAAIFSAGRRRAGVSGSGQEIPAFKKVFSYVISDHAGRILIRLRTQGYETEPEVPLEPNQTPWREPFALEVFDSSLTYRGRLVAPRSANWRGASLAHRAAWLVHEGGSGELYLVKWRAPQQSW